MFDFRRGLGTTGVVMAAIAAITMCILSYLYHPIEIQPLQYGVCLPSPDIWSIDPFVSWIVNTIAIALIVLLLFLVNRHYNFVRTTEPALVAIFMVMAASGPWFTQAINTSVLLCLANVVCMGIIFDTYASKNATREMFIMGIVIGMGSMVQYAFLPLAVVFILWALLMKVLKIKETLAYIAGILCPYWIALGIGWVDFNDFHFPSLTPLFSLKEDPSEFIILLVGIGIAAIVGFLVSLVNFMKLYAGNSRVNAMNLCVMSAGAMATICILVDFDNIHAYVTTLYMACAVQLANIVALWNPRVPWTVTAVPALIYIALFAGSIVF